MKGRLLGTKHWIRFWSGSVTLLLVLFCASGAHAQSACSSVDLAWFNWVASGTSVYYGYTLDATTQQSKPLTSVGVAKFLGTSVQASGNGAVIQGVVSGSEKQNSGGVVTTQTFGTSASTFTFDTNDCTGTVTRVFSNGTVVVWHVALVDGVNTIRYMDARGNPSVRTGSLQLMK